VFLWLRIVILSFFSSRGWESWDIANRPLVPERMPVLVDDDLLFEDGPGALWVRVSGGWLNADQPFRYGLAS
jgi:hypothetical protein